MSGMKWIKVATDIFQDEKMVLIENYPNYEKIQLLWLKILCLAGKNNIKGVLAINEKLTINEDMLASILRENKSELKDALTVLEEYGMISIINDVIAIPNWSKHQSEDKYERKKQYDREYQRKRRTEQKEVVENKKSYDDKTIESCDVVSLEQEVEKEQEREEQQQDVANVNDIKYLKVLLSGLDMGDKDIIQIYNNSNCNVEHIKFIYERLNNQNNPIENKVGWMKQMVKNGVYKENIIKKKFQSTRFNNFKARDYDYESLEKQLLGWE